MYWYEMLPRCRWRRVVQNFQILDEIHARAWPILSVINCWRKSLSQRIIKQEITFINFIVFQNSEGLLLQNKIVVCVIVLRIRFTLFIFFFLRKIFCCFLLLFEFWHFLGEAEKKPFFFQRKVAINNSQKLSARKFSTWRKLMILFFFSI